MEIVICAFPPLLKTTGKTLLLPISTLEKLRFAWLALRVDTGTGFTVSLAEELVTLPSSPETITVNCSPLSAVVVAGVV